MPPKEDTYGIRFYYFVYSVRMLVLFSDVYIFNHFNPNLSILMKRGQRLNLETV